MPRKLGQHFLKNKEILEKIAKTLEINSGETIIEIGSGHGELTREIKNQNSKIKIVAIEKDKNLARELKKENINNLKVIEGDALKVLPELVSRLSFTANHYKVVGNIPYYITGHLLRIIGELESKPLKTVLLIQKEVAQRICAKSPHSSLLSLSVQFWAEPKIIASVPAKDFLPPPEVSSSVIVLDAIRKENDAVGRAYYLFIKAAFKHPRKTLYNNLLAAGFSGEEIIKTFDSLGIEHGIRASVLEEPEAEKMGRILYLQS